MDKGAPPDGYGQYPQLESQYDTTSDQPYAAPSDTKYFAPPPNQGYVGPYGHPQQQPPMQYGQPYVQQPQHQQQQQQYGQQVVTVPPAGHTVIVQQPVARPASYMWLSCLVYWCCNCIAGGIAFALSLASSSAADENRMEEARNYGKGSLWTSVVGIILGVITIIVIIFVFVTVSNETVDEINDDYYNRYSSS